MYCTQRENFAYACHARRHSGFHFRGLDPPLSVLFQQFFAAATLSIHGKSCARMRWDDMVPPTHRDFAIGGSSQWED